MTFLIAIELSAFTTANFLAAPIANIDVIPIF